MKKGMILALLLLAEGFFLPAVALGQGEGEGAETEKPNLQTESGGAVLPEETAVSTGIDQETTIRVLIGDQVETMSLGDYLWGVLAAEMPAAFEEEALKAQAVAARSETLYRQANPSSNHPDADVCADYTCCQAYLTAEEAAAKWGELADEYTEKLRRAVSDTNGMVVKYEGEIIQAVFHSSSDGHTLAASEVWGGDLPYLQEVSSPEGEEVPNYYSVVTVDPETFRQTILSEAPNAQLGEDPAAWEVDLQYNDNGTLTTVTVGGEALAATKVRTLFGLRSARFTLETGTEGVTFYVTGYGHGVGMSQYGANAMAKEGKTYEEILTWYYTGVTVEPAS